MTMTTQRPDDVDAPMVARAVAGDLRAFDWLVIKYQRRVQRLISRLVRDSDLVEDIAQETFLRAYRALAQFRGESKFYTWLYRIAVNTARRQLLTLKHQPSVGGTAPSDGDDDETFWPRVEPSTDETPETALAARELALAVEQAMAALTPDLRLALTLREIDGMSYEDIAQHMQSPIGTVRSRIFRAREAVSAQIKPLLTRQGGKRW